MLIPQALAAVLMIAADPIIFVGTYTKPPSEGIYAFRLDQKTGHLTALGLKATTSNPSFVALHPNGKFLYAVNENTAGTVTAFAVNRDTATLTELNQVSTRGDGPCHLSVHPNGQFLIAVNYGGGSTIRIPIDQLGRLGPPSAFRQHAKPEAASGTDSQRQSVPHAHSVNYTPDGKFALVADLGRDEVIAYQVDRGGLEPSRVTKLVQGAGPRHLAFHPSGKVVYVINELNSTITRFNYDAFAPTMKEMQTIPTLPGDFSGPNSTAEVLVHPSGKFVYGSNRGHNSIAMFSIGAEGNLRFLGTEPTRGTVPRSFAIDPTGQFLVAANQTSGTLVVFSIDQNTGRLAVIGDPVEAASAVCVRFLD